MNYKDMAKEIVEEIGGVNNISQVTNCATRLRFILNDENKVKEENLKKIKGVAGIAKSGGQFQVIIGTEVPKVKMEVEKLGDFNKSVDNNNKRKSGIINNILDVLSGSITPMIPALTGAGLMKAFMALFVTLNFIDKTSDTYIVINFIADTAFYFMPIMVAYGASKKFNSNTILSMVIAAVLLHPNYSNIVSEGTSIKLLGMPITLVSYGSTVLPAILSTWLLSYIEKFSEKVIPKFLKYFLKPLVIIAITAPITLLFLAPLGNILGNIVANGINSLNSLGNWIIPTVIGAIFPLLIMTGMHWSLAPIWLGSIATTGSEILLGPGSLASNIAQGAASLCVAMKTKNVEQKQIASSAGFTALMGITEPAMFGVTIKHKGVLMSVMLGGLVGGFFAGITGVVRYSAGGAGIALLPCFIGENPMNIVYALLTMVISFIVTFACTWIFGFKDLDDNEVELQADKKNNIKVDNIEIYAPIVGKVISLKAVNDNAFSSGRLGRGIAIIPQNGKIYAPFEGKVTMIFDTLHAVALKSVDGAEVLIHIGLDTVKLGGKYFKSYVKVGDYVKQGEVILEFDKEKIIECGYDIVTPVVITNENEFKNIDIIESNSSTEKEIVMKLQFN